MSSIIGVVYISSQLPHPLSLAYLLVWRTVIHSAVRNKNNSEVGCW